MEIVLRAKILIKLLEDGRLYFQNHKNVPERMKNFPINSQAEVKMARDIEMRIRTILFSVEEVKEDKNKLDILMQSLTKICQMATENYHNYFEEIKRHIAKSNELQPYQRKAIEESLKVLHN